MAFPTFEFAIFISIVLPVSWMLRSRPTPWKLFILGASYWFYGAWDARFLLLLIAMTIVNEIVAVLNHRSRSNLVQRAIIAVGVSFDLGVLAFFKYYGFFTDSLEDNLGISSPALDIVLPIGISFFTFQAISYIIDVHRRESQPASLLDFAVFLSFFPQLVAGPIVRFKEFHPELQAKRVPTEAEASQAVQMIARGLFKKVVISDFLAQAIINDSFATPGSYGALDMAGGVYGYAIRIYADFSGYTDMAIGLALLLGFRLPQNFELPYTAASVQEFWRRWHMTLSRWLRDYLYIPLGGNRGSRLATYRNLIVTMLLGGLWHGAAGVFVLWGLYHGLGLAGERLLAESRNKRRRSGRTSDARVAGLAMLYRGVQEGSAEASAAPSKPRLWLCRFLTFQFVCFGWILFNSDSLERVGDVLNRFISGWDTGPELLTPLVAVTIIAAIAAQFIPERTARRFSDGMARLPIGWTAVWFSVWVMIVVAFGPEGVSEFIYFQF